MVTQFKTFNSPINETYATFNYITGFGKLNKKQLKNQINQIKKNILYQEANQQLNKLK